MLELFGDGRLAGADVLGLDVLLRDDSFRSLEALGAMAESRGSLGGWTRCRYSESEERTDGGTSYLVALFTPVHLEVVGGHGGGGDGLRSFSRHRSSGRSWPIRGG